MTRNRGGTQRRSLHQLLNQSRRRKTQVNNERAIISDSASVSPATSHRRRITRSQPHAFHSIEFDALPDPSSPLHIPSDPSNENSERPSFQSDSGLLDLTPALSDSSLSQPDETSDHWKPPHDPLDYRFLLHEGRLNYQQLRQREIFENRYVKLGISDTATIHALITGTGLMNTITDVGSFPREMILEFYANFSGNPDDRVFVRGSMFEFSPQSINRVYKTPDVESHPVSECNRVLISKHTVAQHLSEGRCTNWSRLFIPEVMPHYLAALFRNSCYNWIPSKNVSDVSIECAKLLFMVDQKMRFNFGKLVFDQVARVARSPGHLREIIPFANLIYNVLASQKIPRLKNSEYAELLLPGKMFDASLHRYGYNPSSDPQSSSTVHAKSLSDGLRAQAQELDRQSNELHMRATQLRTMASKMDEGENEASNS